MDLKVTQAVSFVEQSFFFLSLSHSLRMIDSVLEFNRMAASNSLFMFFFMQPKSLWAKPNPGLQEPGLVSESARLPKPGSEQSVLMSESSSSRNPVCW